MTVSFSKPARIVAGLIAVAALVALAMQTTINVGRDGSPLVAFGMMMRFFTIWSNFGAGLILAWIAVRGRMIPQIPFALATALAIVGLVYHLLLAADHHPVGLDWYTNQMHHTIIPLATIGWWLAFSHPHSSGWRTVPVVIAVPVIYTVFALGVGQMTGFYPYFFLDLPSLGWAHLLLNIVGLGVVFAIFGALLMTLRQVITARA